MTRRSLGWLAAAVLLLIAVVAAVQLRHRPAELASATAGTAGTAVSAGGITLASTSVELPDDDAAFPPGHGSDLLDAQCTGCHSASMVLGQPPLKPEQWKATVTKMREVYKAPIAERDVAALLADLSAISARRAAAMTPR